MEPQGPDNRRQLLTLLIVSVVFAGGYMAYAAFTSSDPGEQRAMPAGDPSVPTVQETDEGDLAARESQDSQDSQDSQEQQEQPEQPEQADPERDDPARQEQSAEPMDPAQRLHEERLVTIQGVDYVAEASSLNTGLAKFTLTNERWAGDDGTKQMVTTDKEPYYPLRVDLGGVDVPADAIWDVEQVSDSHVRFTWEGNGFRVTRDLEAGDGPYQLWSTVSITNTGQRARPVRTRMRTYHYVRREEEEGGFFAAASPAIGHGICAFAEEEVERIDREDGLAGHGFGSGRVRLAGVENQYFANVMAVEDTLGQRCQVRTSDRGWDAEEGEPDGALFETTLVYPRVDLGGGDTHTVRTLAYLGPKDPESLEAAGHGLKVVVDRGWFSAVAEWLVDLLGWIYGFVGNWGLAIIVMTVMVRIVMFPLTWKSFQSMAKMRVLKPKMDAVNAMYKDDPQQKGAAIMELYRKEKINPLGGCLPSLLQMPVWFAFYASLSSNTELYHADFALWYTDLSAPDPYFVLPIAVGGLMFVQQKITPTAMDPTQAKIMMYFMPIMITSFLLFLPSGLCLYMVTNSVLGIGQQQWIHRSLKQKEEDDAKEGKPETAGDGSAPSGDGKDDTVGDADESETDSRSSSVVSVTRPKKGKSRKAAKRRTRRAR